MQIQPWRPVSQSDLDGIRAAAIEVFDAWLARWIAQLPSGASEASYAALPRQASRVDSLDWRIGTGIRVAVSEGAMDRAAFLAIDLPRTGMAEDEDDTRAVIEALKRGMADDMVASIATIYGEISTERLGAAHRLADDHSQALVLELRRPGMNVELTFHFDRAWVTSRPLSAPDPLQPAPLTARTMALQENRVAVSAVLGRCRLTVMELASLAIGDVVTCDTRVDDPVDLSLISPMGRSGPAIAKAKPGRSGNTWAFLVSEIESHKVGNER